MKITCTGRKVNLKDAFIQRVETKLAKLDKFFSDSAEANVTVTVEKDWQTVEVTVKDKGFTSRAEKSADRMEDAFDAAVDLLTRRIVKTASVWKTVSISPRWRNSRLPPTRRSRKKHTASSAKNAFPASQAPWMRRFWR